MPPMALLRLLTLVVTKELDDTASEQLVFRRNSIASKLATFYAKRFGRDMLLSILQVCAATGVARVGALVCS